LGDRKVVDFDVEQGDSEWTIMLTIINLIEI
jgi:hypothetical protein